MNKSAADETESVKEISVATGREFPSPSAAITIDVLMKLSTTSPEPIQLRQLGRSLEVPRSTLHRVLQTLEGKGMVRRVGSAGYVIGDQALLLGARGRVNELPRLAEPILRELHASTGETVNLAVPHEGAMLVLAAVQSSEPLRMVSWAGKHDGFHTSALGKSYLAALPDEVLEENLRNLTFSPLTPKSLISQEELVSQIKVIRSKGYAVDEEESVEGVRCVGAALLAAPDQVLGALSVSAPASRLTDEGVEEVASLVVRAAANISGLLGSAGD